MAEENIIKFKIQSDDASLEGTRKKIEALKSEMLKTSDAESFNKMALQAGELETEIRRVEDAVTSLAGSGSELTKMSNSFSRVGSSLATMDFGAAAEEAGRLAAISKSMNFGSAIKSLKSLGSTFMSLGKALLTNPFFLLVGVVVAIGVALYKLMDELGVITAIFEAVGAAIDWVIQKLKDLLDWFGLTSYAADEQAEAEDKLQQRRAEAYARSNRSIENDMNNQISLMKAQGASVEEVEDAEIELAKTRALNHIEETRARKAQLKSLVTIGIATKEQKDELASLMTETSNLVNAVEVREAEIAKARSERASARATDAAKAADEIAKIEEEKAENTAKFIEQIKRKEEDLEIAAIENKTDREEAANLKKLERQAEDIDFTQMTVEAKLEWDKWYISEVERIEQEAADKKIVAAEKAIEDQELLNEKAAAAEELLVLKKEADDKEAADKALALATELENGKRQLLDNSLSSLSANLEEGSVAAKGVAVAQTTIDTYRAAQAIFASTAASPISIAFPAAPFLAAASAVTMGLANVRKIMATKSNGSSGAPSGGATMAPPSLGSRQGGDTTPSMNLNNGVEQNAGGSTDRKVMVVDYFDIQDKGMQISKLQNRVSLI